jgi:HSP20 family protein
MSTRALTRSIPVPALFQDFFKPWNEWFDNDSMWNRKLTIPAANISEKENEYLVSLAAPGLKKDDFKIEVDGNLLTISCEKEEQKEEKEETMNRTEYSYTSFSRSFTMPEDVKMDAIDASYENGVLKLMLPRKEEARKNAASKRIAVH